MKSKMNYLVSTRTSLMRATNLLLGSAHFRISIKPFLRSTNQTFSTTGLKFSSSSSDDSDGTKSDFRPSEDLLKERYDSRSSEEPDRKRARLLYQSRKRGMLENGVILASFANKFLHQFDDEQLDQYDRLINLPTNDWDIFYWATKTKPTPPEFETPVMQKLREHLNSKVSKENDHNDEIEPIKGKRNSIYMKQLDDIAMPAAKKNYQLDIDPSQVSLTHYEEELFDDRVKTYKSNVYTKNMTQWRKDYFLKRIRRTIPAPISLKNLSDDKTAQVYTQKTEDSNIGKGLPSRKDLVDTKYDRTLKHHNFVQHLLGSEFTDDARMYDDEAEAWSDAMWHRNYGSEDSDIAPSSITCSSCSAELHCCDPGLTGYLPKELLAKLIHGNNERAKCQRCTFSHNYNLSLSTDVEHDLFIDLLRQLRATKSSIVCLLVDLTDFPSGLWEGIIDLIGLHHKIIVVGNKLDLLPYDGPRIIERVTHSLKRNLSKLRPGERNLNIKDVMVLSARTGFGVEGLITRLLTMASKNPGTDVYLVGGSYSGKSTLFNALMQTDLCHLRKGDLLGRISTFQLPSSNTLKMIRFPVANLEEWELILKQKKSERVERNFKVHEQSLGSTTKYRQASQPHLSMLLNRIDHEPLVQSLPPSSPISEVVENDLDLPDDSITERKKEEIPKLGQDHPFQKLDKPREPLSARPEEFNEHGFFHLLPSASNKDQLHDLLTNNEKLEVFPHETIIPRKYSLRPLQSIFIAGLARLDLLTAQSSVIFTIFASKYLPVHVIQTRKADQFYCKFLGSPYLGVPFGDERRLEDWPGLEPAGEDIHIKSLELHYGVDVVLSSVGWALVRPSIDQECLVRAYTPEARGIHERRPPLLACTGAVMRRGRKIRDTPLFQHPHYQIRRVSADW